MAKINGYNERKGAQVIAYFANKCKNSEIEILKVVKLVYLADRASLRLYGFPILDDQHFSLPRGPVNSCTYDYLKGELESVAWSQVLIDRANHQVKSKISNIEAFDELSEADVEILESVWAEFGNYSKYDLVEYTHNPANIPEWEDPEGGATKIPLRRTLDALGYENSAAQEQEILAHRSVAGLMKKLRA